MKWVTSCSPLALTAAVLMSGCLPPDSPQRDLARFDITRYSANIDSTGWGGLWVVAVKDHDWGGEGIRVYRRTIVRLEPVAGETDTYRFHYCGDDFPNDGPKSVENVVATGNELILPTSSGSHLDMQMQADGHASASWSYWGNAPVPHGAVRISADPHKSIGTITATQSVPESRSWTGNADCFVERMVQFDGPDDFQYLMFAAAYTPMGNDPNNVLPGIAVARNAESKSFYGSTGEASDGAMNLISGDGIQDSVRSTVARVTGTMGNDSPQQSVKFNIRF